MWSDESESITREIGLVERRHFLPKCTSVATLAQLIMKVFFEVMLEVFNTHLEIK